MGQEITNNGRQAHVKTDLSVIFLYENRFSKAKYNNSAYDSVTLYAGTVLGRVASTGFIKPMRSTYSDGSQIPMGVLADDYVVPGGEIIDMHFCNYGDVSKSKLIFDLSTDNLETTVGSQRVEDLIHQAGIRVIETDEQTGFDN